MQPTQRLDAALRIYARAGVGDLDLNTLADEAGVSNGTVYNYIRALITVVRYAEGMRSTLATYLRADLQAGRRQGDFHYAHEEMAMSMVISATLGAMNLLVEDGEVEHADRIAAEMVLQALGGPPGEVKRIAGLPLPGEVGWSRVPEPRT